MGHSWRRASRHARFHAQGEGQITSTRGKSHLAMLLQSVSHMAMLLQGQGKRARAEPLFLAA